MTSELINVTYKHYTVASYPRASVWGASKDNVSPSLG
jgi:hypothetical protein